MKPGRMVRKLRFSNLHLIGVILVILAAFTVVQGWYFLHKQGQTVDCQTRYNQAFLETLRARTDLSERDRKNNEEFIASWGAPGGPDKALAAAIRYLETKAAIDAERNRFPYPDLNAEGKC